MAMIIRKEKARPSALGANAVPLPLRSALPAKERLDQNPSGADRRAFRQSDSGPTNGREATKLPVKAARPDKITVAIVDDHPLYRDGVVQTLSRTGSFAVVAQGANKDQAISIARDYHPNVMLLDVSIPGNGVETAAEITSLYPGTKVVFLTVSDDDANVFAALQAGGRGYVLKGISGPELANMLVAVHGGETVISPGLAGRLLATRNSSAHLSKAGHSELTVREDEILNRVTEGLTNKEVARVLGLTEKTVKHYMTTIMQKLHVRNRVEAAMTRRPTAVRCM